jgi:ABC-type glycerol-3-phosphate transport system substrate-binding protein
MHFRRSALASATLLLGLSLAACGGANGSGTAQSTSSGRGPSSSTAVKAVDKYVGTWRVMRNASSVGTSRILLGVPEQ